MLRKISILAILILAVFCIGAKKVYASDWPALNYNTHNNNYISDPTILNPRSSAPYYQDMSSAYPFPIIGDEVLYTADGASQTTIKANKLDDMSLLWTLPVSRPVTNMAFDDGILYVAAGNIIALDAKTGQSVWTYSVASNSRSKIYHVNSGRVFASINLSNMYYMLILEASAGQQLYKSLAPFTDNINDITLSNSRIYVNYGRYYGNGSNIESFDVNSYQFVAKSPTCRSSNAQAMFDSEKNLIYLTASDGALFMYDGETLQQKNVGWTAHLSRFVKYGNNYYSAYGRSIQYLSAGNSASTSNYGNVLDTTTSFSAGLIIVNGVIYAPTSRGQLYARNLQSGEERFFAIDANYSLQRIIYGGGHFVLCGVNGNSKRLWIYGYGSFDMMPVRSGASVYSPYNTSGMNQYLGQTHAHVEPEREIDPAKVLKNSVTAADVVGRYRDAGYDFVALTEHNKLLSDPFVQRVMHIQSEEDTQGAGGNHILALGINAPIDESKSDQERIDAVAGQGGVPILAHPNSKQYFWATSTLLEVKKYYTIEIFNNALFSHRIGSSFMGSYLSTDKWDELLDRSLIRFGDAGDDYTPYDGGFDGGAIIVFSPTNSNLDILGNIKAGNFYAVEGSEAPRITSIETNDDHMSIGTNQPCHFDFIGKGGKVLKSESNVNSSIYVIQGDEIYVRAEIRSLDTGKRAWTQPVFISRPLQVDVPEAGKHDLYLDQAVLTADTTAAVAATSLKISDYPAATPPSGYLSPVYQFTTTGQVNEGTSLSISYMGKKLLSKADNLSIYYYNESLGAWQAIPSVVNESNQLVMANLNHFSLYTLSAKIAEDSTAPSLSLVSPADLSDLQGVVKLIAEAEDDQGVMNMAFYCDETFIASDNDGSDGYGVDFDTANLVSGVHKLLITAEDAAGNTNEKSYEINILSEIDPLTISLNSPAEGIKVWGKEKVVGEYSSALPIASLDLYIDEVWVRRLPIENDQFGTEFDWETVVEGDYSIKLLLLDNKGNAAVLQRTVRVGKRVEAVISSPQPVGYLRNSNLAINITTDPPEEYVEIKLDGQTISNNSSIDLLYYQLGQHNLAVEYGGEVIVSVSFNIITSYDDTIATVWRFYREGKIKNRGIAEAISVHLTNAEIFGDHGLLSEEKRTLEVLLKFIIQKDGRNVKIDEPAKRIIMENLQFIANQ